MNKKLNTGGWRARVPLWLSFLTMTAAVTAMAMSRNMDIDSYYMIPLGRSIFESGIPHEYTVSYYPNGQLVAQQWLYALVTYLASTVPGEVGLMLLHAVPMLLLFVLAYRYLSRSYGDPFWLVLSTALCVLCLGDIGYQATIRPENVTLILLLGTAIAMDRYQDTKSRIWLLAPPALLLLEMNLHMTMWPFHFCVMAAYLVPLPEKLAEKIPFRPLSPRPMPDRNQKLSLASMVPVLFLQPYGMDGILYLFRSMNVFRYVTIAEQQPLPLMAKQSIMVVMIAGAIAIMLKNRLLRTEEFCLAAGFTLAGTLNAHAGMFLPLALLAIARPMLRVLADKKPARAADLMPKGVKIFGAVSMCAVIMCAAAVCTAHVPEFRSYHGLDPAIEYMKEHDQGGNILTETDFGSIIYYHGFEGRVIGDSRPELMDIQVNQATDNIKYVTWFENGICTDVEYGPDIQGYLDDYDIQYIFLPERRRVYTYLWGWLECSDLWQKAEHDASDIVAVWERKQKQ